MSDDKITEFDKSFREKELRVHIVTAEGKINSALDDLEKAMPYLDGMATLALLPIHRHAVEAYRGLHCMSASLSEPKEASNV